MIQVLLIISFVVLHLGDSAGRTLLVRWQPGWVWLAVWLPVLVLWPCFHVLARRSATLMETRGDTRAFALVEKSMSRLRLGSVIWFVFCVTALGWQRAAPSLLGDPVVLGELVLLAPVLTFFVALWWSFFPLDLLLRETGLRRRLYDGHPIYPPVSRLQYVWSNMRHQMLIVLLPLMLMSAWDHAMTRLSASHPATWTWWPGAEPWIQWGGVLLLLIVTPALLRMTWDTVRIGDGPVRRQAQEMCARYRVRVAGPYLWRTHGSMVNGAILGIFYPLRYLLLTDALLDQLPTPHLSGVLAHEVAHVRFRHLLWLGASVIGAVLLSGWCVAIVTNAAGWDGDSDRVGMVASGLALAVAVWVMGHVSRRFEWQADAFAARHLSQPTDAVPQTVAAITPQAARIMSEALQTVADLNGIPVARFSWRHGSILTRQQRLESLVGRPLNALSIDRHVRAIKVAAITCILLSLAPICWQFLHH